MLRHVDGPEPRLGLGSDHTRTRYHTHNKALTSLEAAAPRGFPLEQLARLELVGAHLEDAAVFVARVAGRRRGPEGELGDDLVLARLEVGEYVVQVFLEGLWCVSECTFAMTGYGSHLGIPHRITSHRIASHSPCP
jgi:hypothetical protein